jgi:translation initiation factor IF-3
VTELGFVEQSPKQDGRNMIMLLAPHKNLKPRPKATVQNQAATPGES